MLSKNQNNVKFLDDLFKTSILTPRTIKDCENQISVLLTFSLFFLREHKHELYELCKEKREELQKEKNAIKCQVEPEDYISANDLDIIGVTL